MRPPALLALWLAGGLLVRAWRSPRGRGLAVATRRELALWWPVLAPVACALAVGTVAGLAIEGTLPARLRLPLVSEGGR
jgi:hypothetical protein